MERSLSHLLRIPTEDFDSSLVGFELVAGGNSDGSEGHFSFELRKNEVGRKAEGVSFEKYGIDAVEESGRVDSERMGGVGDGTGRRCDKRRREREREKEKERDSQPKTKADRRSCEHLPQSTEWQRARERDRGSARRL